MPIYNLAYGIQTTPTPTPPFTPGANTILYAPLKTDLIDTITNTAPTVRGTSATISDGVANLQWAGLYYSTGVTPQSSTPIRTVSMWCNITAQATYNGRFMRPGGWTNDAYRKSNGAMGMWWANEGDCWFSNLNEWNLWTLTYDGSVNTFYKNGVGKSPYNVSISASGDQAVFGFEGSSDGFSGKLSELIVEDVAWTAQEVEDYYNATCEDYGLSPYTPTYTISNIPTSDTNVYVNVAQSGKTIDSVKFSFTANYTGSQAYIQISGNNSNTNRYGLVFGRNTSGTAPAMAIRGRLGGSDTYYRSITDGFNSSGSNTVEYTINRSGSCSVKCNGTTSTYTATGAELTVLQTIMNLSNMNVYGAQNSSVLSNNQVNVEVTYS